MTERRQLYRLGSRTISAKETTEAKALRNRSAKWFEEKGKKGQCRMAGLLEKLTLDQHKAEDGV